MHSVQNMTVNDLSNQQTKAYMCLLPDSGLWEDDKQQCAVL